MSVQCDLMSYHGSRSEAATLSPEETATMYATATLGMNTSIKVKGMIH